MKRTGQKKIAVIREGAGRVRLTGDFGKQMRVVLSSAPFESVINYGRVWTNDAEKRGPECGARHGQEGRSRERNWGEMGGGLVIGS